MSVLAVIPCLNEVRHLAPLLKQMLDDTVIDQLVVVDGGSTDGSRELVAAMADGKRLILLDNPDRIQSAGVNRAVSRFGYEHDWLLRIDAHCLYPDGYAARLLLSAQNNQASAVVVPMVTAQGRLPAGRRRCTEQHTGHRRFATSPSCQWALC
jgi:succinoglycan biosynthesis protein ExoA